MKAYMYIERNNPAKSYYSDTICWPEQKAFATLTFYSHLDTSYSRLYSETEQWSSGPRCWELIVLSTCRLYYVNCATRPWFFRSCTTNYNTYIGVRVAIMSRSLRGHCWRYRTLLLLNIFPFCLSCFCCPLGSIARCVIYCYIFIFSYCSPLMSLQ